MSNDWVYMSILLDCKSVPLLQFFLWFKSAIWWTSINPNLVYALANRRFFPRFSSTRRKMWAFKPVLLHVKITRSTNLCSVCRRRLELSTYLNTESYNHISFLNTRWQLVWVLASSGFYWVFNNMKNDDKIRRVQNSFSKTASVHRKPLSLVGVISSVCLTLCGSLVIRPRLPCFHTIK